jgi:hypothetical protein
MRGNVLAADDFDITQTNLGDKGQFFDAEEMQAIREQYEERLAVEVEKREELEWQVRMALATIRDAELDARRAADQMHKVHEVLQSLLSVQPAAAAQPTRAPSPAPAPRATAPRATAPRATTPPPAPRRSSPTLPGLNPPKPAAKAAPPPIPAASKSSGPLPPRSLTGYKRLAS